MGPSYDRLKRVTSIFPQKWTQTDGFRDNFSNGHISGHEWSGVEWSGVLFPHFLPDFVFILVFTVFASTVSGFWLFSFKPPLRVRKVGLFYLGQLNSKKKIEIKCTTRVTGESLINMKNEGKFSCHKF